MEEYRGLHAPAFVSVETEFLEIFEWMILGYGYQDLLEIGTNQGTTTRVLDRIAGDVLGHVTTVDPVGTGARKEEFSHTTFLTMSSAEFFRRKPSLFDFILIDGDHGLEVASEDLANACRHLTDGGVIAVHDTMYLPSVAQAVLPYRKRNYPWFELLLGKGLCMFWPTGKP